MRSYSQNSPEATARIITMMMLADGHASHLELAALDHLPPHESLGISRATLLDVMQDFCQDMQMYGHLQWSDTSSLDGCTIRSFMAEIDDPHLRRSLLRLCSSIVEADCHVSEGESLLLGAAVECWGMHDEMAGRRS